MATLNLRPDKLEELLRERGATSNVAAGELLGMNDSTISRIRSGAARPGDQFIANALSTFAVTFDELFEVAA